MVVVVVVVGRGGGGGAVVVVVVDVEVGASVVAENVEVGAAVDALAVADGVVPGGAEVDAPRRFSVRVAADALPSASVVITVITTEVTTAS